MKLPTFRVSVIVSLLCLWLLSVASLACNSPNCDEECVLSERWCSPSTQCGGVGGCLHFAKKVYFPDACSMNGQGTAAMMENVDYDQWSSCTPQCTADCSPTPMCMNMKVDSADKDVFTKCDP
jgi:hypothetical protein